MGQTDSRSVLILHAAGILLSKELPEHTQSHLGIGATGFTSACFRKESALPHCPTCFCGGKKKKRVLRIHPLPLHCGLAWGFDGDGFSLMILGVQFLVCFPLILSLSVSVFKGKSPN